MKTFGERGNMMIFFDHTLIIYALILLICFDLLYSLITWWVKFGKAKVIYKCVTFLIAGIAISSLVNVIVRFQSIGLDYEYLCAWWWPFRNYCILIPLAVFSHIMRNRRDE